MKPLVLTADQARAVAHKAGVCFEIVSRAVETSKAEGKPVTVAMQMLGGAAGPSGPPQSILMVTFAAGHVLAERNVWAGCACAPISDQKELNLAIAVIERTIEIVEKEVEGLFIRL